jgi:hypothetical protein
VNQLRLIALFLVIGVLISSLSEASAAEVSTNNSSQVSSFSLSSQKWKNRLLLVFAPSASNNSYQQQIQRFSKYKQDFAERDLVLIQVLSEGDSYANGHPIDSASATKLRDRFGVAKQDFRVVLVGKDGGTKRTDSNPVQARTIFNEIDAMPMRQQEMRRQNR